MRVFYSADYVGSAVSFETTRKSRWIADSLERIPIASVELVAPDPLTWDQLVQVHDPEFVGAVKTGHPRSLAESQGFRWNDGLWPMVLSSNGGAVAAALDALEHGIAGSLSSGMHHARREHGAGFCTFNGLVLAARGALAAGAESVLILDLDAHWGGGTASLVARDPRVWQLDITVSDFDGYAHLAQTDARMVRDPAEYLMEIRRGLAEVRRRAPRFDLCLYNAGMDPYEGCSIGGLVGITRDILAAREKLVFEWCREQGTPIAFVLGGGYMGPLLNHEGLVELHRATLMAACDR